ncbi:YhhA family cyclophane-containing RiPP [Paraburkholderia caledonica]|uniref:Uncharacterized protein n=1 Tax=Paraburkholderia caledonica TaxID=134536 RepID=A0AB73I6E1_9BURK|nr:hypothetical protein [Paraburkholderia caledonica]
MHQGLNIGAEQPVIAPTQALGAKMDLEVNLSDVSSVALARLVEEVRNEDLPGATMYDRTYNRHNR